LPLRCRGDDRKASGSKKTAVRRNKHYLACRAGGTTKGAKSQSHHGADGSGGKVAGKSRRRRRSGLLSPTEPATADLPRDCPRAAAPTITAVRRNKHYLACRAGGTTKGSTASSPESGAISRRYPVVLPRSSDRSVLAYVTGAATTARPAGASEIAPCHSEASRIISRNSSRESSDRCLPFLASFSLNFMVVSVIRS